MAPKLATSLARCLCQSKYMAKIKQSWIAPRYSKIKKKSSNFAVKRGNHDLLLLLLSYNKDAEHCSHSL